MNARCNNIPSLIKKNQQVLAVKKTRRVTIVGMGLKQKSTAPFRTDINLDIDKYASNIH